MTQTIINQATELLNEQFTNGQGLRGVPLKNYSGPKLEEWSERAEVDLIKQALASAQFSQKKAAQQLGVTYHQLRGLLKKYQLLESSADNE